MSGAKSTRQNLKPGSRLPNYHAAYIQHHQLTNYVLCSDHADGRHKARLFRSVLGIDGEDWQYLHDQILSKLPDADAIQRTDTAWGSQWKVVVEIEGRNGARCQVATCWEIAADDRPRFTNAFIERKARANVRRPPDAGEQGSIHAA